MPSGSGSGLGTSIEYIPGREYKNTRIREYENTRMREHENMKTRKHENTRTRRRDFSVSGSGRSSGNGSSSGSSGNGSSGNGTNNKQKRNETKPYVIIKSSRSQFSSFPVFPLYLFAIRPIPVIRSLAAQTLSSFVRFCFFIFITTLCEHILYTHLLGCKLLLFH